ncbi:MAG: hypothetical protein J6O61_06390 [Butyrivibrio sp.]|uniref:DUF5702 domain-containing protein n=1 Tax=Butyrivibrio sp. TaxID=28121 RepID=UPI001B103A76|nr:DUF5702 domain-containing protein [Butyrivibrio sp.]MBO6240457.1 hypothetical protein [Butyrivibrio sp.]
MRLQTKGYLTVYLSLSITIILSLILVLYEGARIGAVKMKTECVADISMNSVLAEYNRQLYEQYGLLMVDTSYGTENHTIVNTEEHLRNYVQKNLELSLPGRALGRNTMLGMYCKDARISGSSFATDNGGAVLNRQILSYMGADIIGGAVSQVEENVKSLKEAELDTTDVNEMARENQEQIDAIELPTIVNEDGEEEQISLGNPADTVNSQRGIGALNLAVRDKSRISNASVNLTEYASHREQNKGTGLSDNLDISLPQRALIEQYYYEKCGYFGEEMDKSLLKYQLEYLAFGQNSDYANLEKVAEMLLFWRQASNMLYLFNCRAKVDAADLAASLLTAVMLVPELKELVKYSILFAWTFAESIIDLNTLFSGGRVPLFKSDDTWNLGLEAMFSFRDHMGGGECGEGLYYKDYLRMIVFMTNFDKKTQRLMDIMEMDIRKTVGNAEFRIDHCLDCFRAEIEIGTSYGYEARIERVYGYEE